MHYPLYKKSVRTWRLFGEDSSAARSSVGISVGARWVAGCGRTVAFDCSHGCLTVLVSNETGLRMRQQWRSETRGEVELNQTCSGAEELTGQINVSSARRRLQKIDDQNRGSARIKNMANSCVERQRSVSAAYVGGNVAGAAVSCSVTVNADIVILHLKE
ncbi:uncharacterized protein NFIA_043740 [Aspergillus fischeri NRRL 181]|uniref:Uncharacterized protein n=1 Tax=Neosartorya fischeri (strain ATCC 1020 / DSM 3700 / CBS 544.65 / FGSC A1164 / JCM 1740 / NRRL 181 / WB 181) TaxID=331117 RepID=A1CUX8_NEOFI|nr:uncharacterized protein NFIA_043740 [Aspergillus fischeri NRRL 181]EAW25555.1 hypothetical protein NFIA_043740 [Aspergillus fischeri NRRL 181]KAG2001382.1 hypothetical protein GB937_010222 [Aspergillus fischeri]